MSRIRTVKPGLFKDEDLAELPMSARLLFIGLFCLADREGRLKDRPKRIKAEIFPYDNVDVHDLLTRLQSAGFIIRYEVGDLKVVQVVNFKKHQRITGSELQTASELPSRDGKGNTEETLRTHSGNTEDDRKGRERSIGKERKGGFFPPPDFEIELTEMDVGKSVEYLTLTKKINATREIVLSLWTVFKTKNFTGKKFYQDESDIRTHFFNSLKFENISNGTDRKSATTSSKTAGANLLLQKGIEQYNARRTADH